MKDRRDLLEEERSRIGSWGRLNSDRIHAVLKYAGKTVLDAGCSAGETVRFLRRKGFSAFGFDLLPSPEWPDSGCGCFAGGDLLAIPFRDDAFDTSLLFEVLEHVPDVEQALAEVGRVTRETLILSVPDATLPPEFRDAGLTYFHWVDRTHVQFFTPDGIAEALERSGFVVKHQRHINPVRPEILFFESLRIPRPLRKILLKITGALPFRKQRFMTILIVARKRGR